MKKKLSRIAAMLLAVVMVITGIAVMPSADVKAADKPEFTVKVSSTEVKPGDTVHVEFWIEGAADVIQIVGNVNLNSDVYTIDQTSLKLGDLYMQALIAGGMPQVLYNEDQSYSFIIDFMGPVNTSGKVFEFDAKVNENATGTGNIAFEYIGGERGTSDLDRHDVPIEDVECKTVDPEGNVIEGGNIPVIIELEGLAIDQDDFTMARGASDTLTVTATPEAALAGKTVTWSSTDDSVVKVDQEGNIEAVGVLKLWVLAQLQLQHPAKSSAIL